MNATVLIYVLPEVALLALLLGWVYFSRRSMKNYQNDRRKSFADETRPIYERAGLPPLIITESKLGTSIICLYCGWESYHPEDVKHRYCGHCNVFILDKYEKQKAEKGR